MDPLLIGVLAVVLMLVLIYLGMHIGIALTLVSFVCVALLRNTGVAGRMVAAAANDTIREDLFSVVPALRPSRHAGIRIRRGARHLRRRRNPDAARAWRARGGDGQGERRLRGDHRRLGRLGNDLREGRDAGDAPPRLYEALLGRRSGGSSVLGMLIPPSLLLIVYGVLAEESVGKLFIAGILPGLLLAAMFAVMIVGMAYLRLPRSSRAASSRPLDHPRTSPGSHPRRCRSPSSSSSSSAASTRVLQSDRGRRRGAAAGLAVALGATDARPPPAAGRSWSPRATWPSPSCS
jgi:hypothetical protein